MFRKNWFLIKRVLNRLNNVFTLSRSDPTIFNSQSWVKEINEKIKIQCGIKKDCIDLFAYKKYFDFLTELGLREDFEISTTQDNLRLCGTFLRPLLFNNNKKIIIFCHGVTNNRWTIFYCLHLALQAGYQVITYDARNHGLSEKSYNSLGEVEARDLQDVIDYAQKKYQPCKIGLYGFSMGAATCLYWLGRFAKQKKSEVSAIICEAPFDNFAEQLKFALEQGTGYYWKEFLVTKIIQKALNSSYEKLEKINPLNVLPAVLPLELLLIHGLQDSAISWKASFNIWNKLQKNYLNQKKVNLYLCRYADHGEVNIMGDYLPHSLLWKSEKKISKFTFSTLFLNYWQKKL